MFGGEGDTPPAWMFVEEELRSILRILDETPSYNNGWDYNPRGVIRAVNALQPLGKEKALTAVAEYLRVAPCRSTLLVWTGCFLFCEHCLRFPVLPAICRS